MCFSLSVTAYRRATSLIRWRRTLIFLLSKELHTQVHFHRTGLARHRPAYYLLIQSIWQLFWQRISYYSVLSFRHGIRRATSLVRERLALYSLHSKDKAPQINIYKRYRHTSSRFTYSNILSLTFIFQKHNFWFVYYNNGTLRVSPKNI